MTSAPAARTISMTIKASPMRAPRLCEYARQSSRSGPGVATGAVSRSSVVSSMADSWIDDAIQQIDDEIHADDDGRDQQDATLHDWVIARLHAVNQPISHARPGEDGFGQNRARKQQSDLQADYRNHRYQCVAQRMHQHDAPVWQSLGARSAHVVFAQYLEHR